MIFPGLEGSGYGAKVCVPGPDAEDTEVNAEMLLKAGDAGRWFCKSEADLGWLYIM